MDEWGRRDSPGERIEIELTTFEPRTKAPQPTAPADPPAIEPGDQSHDESGSAQRRTVLVTAAAVGVFALALGWALGRGSAADDNDADNATPTASTIAVATTERITDTIAPPVTTARPRPSTTTTITLPPGTPLEVLMSPELRALPYELAVTDYSGSLYRIDLPAATVRTYPSRRSNAPSVAFRPDGTVLIYSPWGDGSTPTAITLEGETTQLETGPNQQNQQLIVDGEGGLWRLQYNTRELELLDDDFEPVGETLTMTANMQVQADPAGGVLISGSNGTFSFDASGQSRRVSVGEIVASGVETLIAYECADDFSCAHVVIDRLTGARAAIDLDELTRTAPPVPTDLDLAFEGANRRIVPPAWFGANANAAVVGRFAVLGLESISTDGQSSSLSHLVVDLERVAVTAHVAAGYSSGIVMSPDGLWGFAPSEGGSAVIAIELATGAQMEYELPRADVVFAIAVRSL
ncbi:MAG TPA: hypothetical protein VMM60_11340 [Ilumatobacter sp.]|nr:hypothetical protein [Ilumatobacter sp.]